MIAGTRRRKAEGELIMTVVVKKTEVTPGSTIHIQVPCPIQEGQLTCPVQVRFLSHLVIKTISSVLI